MCAFQWTLVKLGVPAEESLKNWSKLTPGYGTLSQATTASFYILSSSSFTNDPR
jgi:hypothetical protein